MAADPVPQKTPRSSVAASYLGISFAVFLGLLPRSSFSYIPSLQSRNRILALKLFEAEDQIKQIKSRRREDSKANARVAEILAGQRNTWQQEERRLLARIEAAEAENAGLRKRISELERSRGELKGDVERLQREKTDFGGKEEVGRDFDDNGHGVCLFDRKGDLDEMMSLYGQHNCYGFLQSPSPPSSQMSIDRSNGFKYDSLESMYQMNHFAVRRESPWMVDGESLGVSSKLKLLEHELINLEKSLKGDLAKIPSLMRKQAKRYQLLTEKINDLCRRMQASEPCEAAAAAGLLGRDFGAQQQSEFLVEALRLQSRGSETREKLAALQAEARRFERGEVTCEGGVSTWRSLKEMQRNLEIWVARIVGDLEGVLARESASRVRRRGEDYYISRYPFPR